MTTKSEHDYVPIHLPEIKKITLDLENEKYNIETFYAYWKQNAQQIEEELKIHFTVNIKLKFNV